MEPAGLEGEIEGGRGGESCGWFSWCEGKKGKSRGGKV